MVQTRRYTIEEFEQIVMSPENFDNRLEYIEGEIVEVVSSPYPSAVTSRINYWITHYVMQHQNGHITSSDGGYNVGGERYIPDVGYISKVRQPQLPSRGYIPIAPDLAVEVLSPTDRMEHTRIKLGNYLAAGTVVWILDPEAKTVEVYTPSQKTSVFGLKDTLVGGDVLPGFQVPVKDIFPD